MLALTLLLYYTTVLLLDLSMAMDFRHSQRDKNPWYKGPATFETKSKLPHGMSYVDFAANPFLGKILPGEVVHSRNNVDKPKYTHPKIADDDPKKEIKLDWLYHQLVSLDQTGTEQIFGFSFDIWEKLVLSGKNGSEISHAGIPQPRKRSSLQKREVPDENTRTNGTDTLTKREIMGDDERFENCNTVDFPESTVGMLLFSDAYCSGKTLCLYTNVYT